MGPIGGTVIEGMHAMPARGSGLLSGQPTGSESEPWSMMGSFEDLLNGIVADEPEEEEATLPGSSRFARFFSNATMDDAPTSAPAGSSALASLGGIKLDAPFDPNGGKQEDDWQQGARISPDDRHPSCSSLPESRRSRGEGASLPYLMLARRVVSVTGFRALLPNVNISFSPFGDGARPQPGDGLGGQQLTAPSNLGVVGGLGGLAGFGGFNSSQPRLTPSAPSAIGPGNTSFSGSSSFDMPGGGLSTGLGSSALNGAGSLNLGGASSSSEVSLLPMASPSP